MLFKKDKEVYVYSKVFLYLSITFVVCLLLADILATKFIGFKNYSIPASILIFPVSFIINDILAEVYGYKSAKKVIVFGFLMRVLMVTLFTTAILLPYPDWYTSNDAFKSILGSTPRIAFAGFISYLCGSLANAKVLVKMKGQGDAKFGIRAIVSTIAGEGLDSMIFIPISFLGTVPLHRIFTMIALQVFLKTLYEIICLPITTIVLKHVKKYEKDFNDKVKIDV